MMFCVRCGSEDTAYSSDLCSRCLRIYGPTAQREAQQGAKGPLPVSNTVRPSKRPVILALEEGGTLTPLEAIKTGFVTLCKQYEQMGEQLKFLSYAITELEKRQ